MRDSVILASAAILGALAAWVDWHSDEVQPAVAIIVVSAGVLAGLLPKRAWLVALLVGAGVPILHLLARKLGFEPRYPVAGNGWASLLAFAPAAVGAGGGWLVRVMKG